MKQSALLASLWLGAASSSCTAFEDVVFEALSLEESSVVFQEGAGAVELTLRLSAPPRSPVSAAYGFLELEAQSACQEPDFSGLDASVVWPTGVREVTVPLWIGDDSLAELDERFTLSLEPVEGSSLLGNATLSIIIADDDRTAIVAASSEFGVVPGHAADQSQRLQAALDHAGARGRGVVEMAPGDYEISSVALHPGTTLAARGARFHRPIGAALDAVTLSSRLESAEDPGPTLVDGLSIDGRRDEQGSYAGDERADAHLILLSGTGAQSGRLRGVLQNVTLSAGTASGVFIGPQTDVQLCRIRGSDLWRDIVTLRGGGSRVDGIGIDAEASRGTSGLWFDGQPAGFGGTHRIEVQLANIRLASGDLEIEAYGGSRIDITRLSLLRAPFRLIAPDATVRIVDSFLQLGPARATHNYWGLPHDVEVLRSTLVATEADGDAPGLPEADRRLAAATVRWDLPSLPDELPPLLPVAPPPHRVLFDNCTFQRAADLEPIDTVYAIETLGTGGSVVVRAPTLGPDIAALYAPE